jgi:hypothetical protein
MLHVNEWLGVQIRPLIFSSYPYFMLFHFVLFALNMMSKYFADNHGYESANGEMLEEIYRSSLVSETC